MVAAQVGTMTFVGQSGRIYTIDCYLSDVAAALTTWNASGAAAATSQSYWRTPETCVLTDFSIVTGLTATVGLIMSQDNGLLSGTAIRIANHLNTNPFRPRLSVPFPAGALVQATQF